MSITIENRKNIRRKRILIRNSTFILLGFTVVLLITFFAKILTLSSVAESTLLYLFIISIAITLFFTSLILIKKTITRKFASIIFFSELAGWAHLYILWVFSLNEIRVISLFFTLIVLLVLIANSNILQSLAIAITATIIQVITSYIAIKYFNQHGSLTRELFFTGSFFPVTLFLTNLASLFKKHRDEIKKIRIAAEKARDSLWGEMALAKKIQSILLPDKPAITGFEITAYMKPADEVGGDYYDIINIGSSNWIVIGDVSGHGVPAGLIMMMVQTTIWTALTKYPGMPPSQLLTIINSTIAKNITKLGEDKYITIMVIAAMEKGKFYFSGLHQDIMVYRSETKKVELLETNGMWIGIVDNIDGMNKDDTFSMKKDDVILLYTDGITEATDETGAMFSEEQLEDIFTRAGTFNTDEIKKRIQSELSLYHQNDDVTMVIIKKL